MYIYGRQPVAEALHSSHVVHRVILAPKVSGKVISRIKRLCQTQNVPIEIVEKGHLQRFVGPVVHQGVIAEVEFQPFLDEQAFATILNKPEALLLFLDQIQDPHNLGAILRTAEIAGVDLIILPEKGTAPLNATVAKTSAGALFHCQLYATSLPEQTLQQLQKANFNIYAALPQAQQTIYESSFSGKCAIVVGSEDRGVRKALLPYCHTAVKIPQFGKVNSLNASVSTAIILFEAVRQRKFIPAK